jgi:hypothetical protein
MKFGLYMMLCSVALLSPEIRAESAGYHLATPDQKAMDIRTVRIFNDPSFQRRLRDSEKLFTATPQAIIPAARDRIAPDTAAIAFNELQIAVDSDSDRPAFMWSGDAPHHWFGVDVPFASYGFNNPDNIYRIVPIDGRSRYEITGRLSSHPPAQTTFFLYNSVPGDGTGPIDGPIDGLLGGDLKTGPDGAFRIAIDGDTPDGKGNHLHSQPDARLLIVRETLSDWSKETPAELSIKRVGGPPMGEPWNDARVADYALDLTPKLIAFWLKYPHVQMFSAPANTIGEIHARGGKWGYTVNGRFELAEDEGLVVTIEPASAAYVGFQLADHWAIPFEFVRHTSSLANGQTKANPDGTITYVIAARDPGVYNWLDTTGAASGTFGIRWQNLTDEKRIAGAVRLVKLVKLADMPQVLPAGTVMVSPAERKAQIIARASHWQSRLH